jgi:hypothetical protein
MNTSVWVDGKLIQDKGVQKDPELAKWAKKLGKS